MGRLLACAAMAVAPPRSRFIIDASDLEWDRTRPRPPRSAASPEPRGESMPKKKTKTASGIESKPASQQASKPERRRRKRSPRSIELYLDAETAETLAAAIADLILLEDRKLPRSILGVFSVRFGEREIEGLRFVWEEIRRELGHPAGFWPETDGRVPPWFEDKAATR